MKGTVEVTPPMFDIMEYLHYPFIQRMLIAGILASLACGVIGTFVVVRRNVFIAGGISHTTFGGIGIAYYLMDVGWTWMDPMLGAVIVALFAAFILGFGPIKKRFREDSTIGVLWVVGMAVGILFLNLVNWTNITYTSPESILFGDILLISTRYLFMMGSLLVLIYVFVLFFFKDLEVLAFDEEFARITGIRVSLLNIALLVLIALTITVLIKIVGVVLVLAMLTIPAAISNLFTKRLSTMMVSAVVIGTVVTTFGGLLSIELDTPPGATIVIVLGGMFLLSIVVKWIYNKSASFIRSSR